MHQYVDRMSNSVITEELFADKIVTFLYSTTREFAPKLFDLLTGARVSSLLGFCNFDLLLSSSLLGNKRFLSRCGVDLSECLDPPGYFDTPRKIFERKIRYWECRPMSDECDTVVSPADSRVLVGSLSDNSALFLKGKFFDYEELLGVEKDTWQRAYKGGEYAIFRLTPDKYHYNHAPVSGVVEDVYEISGRYHSCNPAAVVEMITPYSKNKRVVTIIQTDVPGGSQVGLVAMIEVVAMMIGEVSQCYADSEYTNPTEVVPGLFVRRGQPKSLYRPGSSTDVLLFQKDRVDFAEDIVMKMKRNDVQSIFTSSFGASLAETDVAVRSLIGTRKVFPEGMHE
ncbi:MAG: phosphatidylserine decarboxylase [Proteobacteria bacterium]|nr:phosphatidylserine decarboxylase [Pseudomonadota bacterium]MBU1739208.1 phosphatidylserine decarboxylase [Pseudomonadota bacterium]